MNKRYRKKKMKLIDEPVMSDKTLLLNVEDLMQTAFGSNKGNRVNFKLLQTTLHILARQLNILEQDVEIKCDEITELAREHGSYDDGYDDDSETYSSSSTEGGDDDRRVERERKRAERREKEDRAGKEENWDKKKLGETGEKEERKDRRGKGEKKDGETSSKYREGRSKDRDEKDKRRGEDDGGEGDRERRRRGEDDRDEGRRKRGRRGEYDGDEDGRERGRRGEDDIDERRRKRGRRGEDDGDEGRRERGRRGEDDGDEGFRKRDRRGDDDRDEGRRERGRRGEDDRDDGGRERGRGREWGGERGADGRGGRGGEREDRDAQRQDRGGLERRDFGRQTSGTSITVSEATRRGSGGRGSADKISVGGRPARIASIEVVTASQFALLGKAVKQLEQITGPLPEPVLPDNETLRQDLAKGRTSLPDTMQAVQMNARVQAAEQGLYRMAELLTQLEQSGVLPLRFATHVGAMEEYLQAAKAAGYAPAGPDPGGSGGPGGPDGSRKPGASPRGKKSVASKKSMASKSYGPSATGGAISTMSRMDEEKEITASAAVDAEAQVKAGVTHNDMNEMLKQMKDALYKEINKLVSRSNHAADMASNISRSIVEKMDTAMQVNERVNTLFQQSEDYAEQVSGFDSGVTTQMNSFQEQLVMMRNDLSGGLALLEASNNNTETAALLDLTEGHQELVVMMDNTVYRHQDLHIAQQQISDELRNLIHCIEMLREQKADRDEVLDGLKDKANVPRLAGLLYEKDFAHARSEIEKRILKCYDIFSRQEMKWREALTDLKAISDNKAELTTLMAMKDATVAELKAIQTMLHKLEIMLGEPKAAMLLRKLVKCGDSLTRALMQPQAATHGDPLPLPALRPPPVGAEQQPCLGEIKLAPPDISDHTCHRWAGGSHTLMSGNVVKEQAEFMQLQIKPTKKFEGYGSDGKLYMMEEGMQPCAECNKLSTDEPGRVSPHPSTPSGAGDQASAPPAK